MITAINAHRSAWQAFQDAPDEVNEKEFWWHTDAQAEALTELLRTIPATPQDLAALKSYLDWWVREEAQRCEFEPELFAIHAVIKLAQAPGGVLL